MSLLDLIAPGLGPVLNVVNTVVDRLVPDKNAAQKLQNEIQKEVAEAGLKGELAQLEVNKAEAASASIFVAGWRPAIGWVCAGALGYQYLLTPLAVWGTSWVGLMMPMPPTLDSTLWQLMFGMLGMGTLRTYEKLKGVSK